MTHRSAGRPLTLIAVKMPSRAEELRHGQLICDGWRFGVLSVYRWQGRQWTVPPRRGKPKVVWFECEEPSVSEGEK